MSFFGPLLTGQTDGLLAGILFNLQVRSLVNLVEVVQRLRRFSLRCLEVKTGGLSCRLDGGRGVC
jgi:hypothetical protein